MKLACGQLSDGPILGWRPVGLADSVSEKKAAKAAAL
jgi:hypothetical protein